MALNIVVTKQVDRLNLVSSFEEMFFYRKIKTEIADKTLIIFAYFIFAQSHLKQTNICRVVLVIQLDIFDIILKKVKGL